MLQSLILTNLENSSATFTSKTNTVATTSAVATVSTLSRHASGVDWVCPDDNHRIYYAGPDQEVEITMQCDIEHDPGVGGLDQQLAHTWQDCANLCVSNIDCYVFSWSISNSTCFLKGEATKETFLNGVWSGTTNRFWKPPRRAGEPPFPVISLWKDNALRRFTYSLQNSTDRAGGDIKDPSSNLSTAQNWNECAAFCAQDWDKGCRAFVWRKDGKLDGCYLKNIINTTAIMRNNTRFSILSLLDPDDSQFHQATPPDERFGIYNSAVTEPSIPPKNCSNNTSFAIWSNTKWRSTVTMECGKDIQSGDIFGYPFEASSIEYCAWLCHVQGRLGNGSRPNLRPSAKSCDAFTFNRNIGYCYPKTLAGDFPRQIVMDSAVDFGKMEFRSTYLRDPPNSTVSKTRRQLAGPPSFEHPFSMSRESNGKPQVTRAHTGLAFQTRGLYVDYLAISVAETCRDLGGQWWPRPPHQRQFIVDRALPPNNYNCHDFQVQYG